MTLEDDRRRERILYGPGGNRAAEFLRLLKELDDEGRALLDVACRHYLAEAGHAESWESARRVAWRSSKGQKRAAAMARAIVGYGSFAALSNLAWVAAAGLAEPAFNRSAEVSGSVYRESERIRGLGWGPWLATLLAPFASLDLERLASPGQPTDVSPRAIFAHDRLPTTMYLNVEEAAGYVGVTVPDMRRLLANGSAVGEREIHSHGRPWRISPIGLDELHGSIDRQAASGILDRFLENWVALAVPEWPEPRRRALMNRLGWSDDIERTLEEVGVELGITRERVRQLQIKLTKALGTTRPPDLEPGRVAIEIIRKHSGEPTASLSRVLCDAGLLRRPISDTGVELMLELLGVPTIADEYQANRRQFLPTLKTVTREARDLTRSVGLASVAWAIADADSELDPALVKQALASLPWVRWLDGTWFWDPRTPRGRNRLENLTLKMLAACGPLEVQELDGGLDRMYRWGRLPHLPPLDALRLFFADHPAFHIVGEVVSSVVELDADELLDSTEETLYHILREAPDGFLDRAALQRAALAAGMNQNTFNVYTTYSPILDNPVVDRWVLRGSDVSPAVLAAHQRQRKHRFALNEWTESGTLRLEREVPGWTLVVSIPRALQPYVEDRTFEAADTHNRQVGRVRWDGKGTSWGYSMFLQGLNASEGDVLIADFDLVAGTVTLAVRRASGEAASHA